MGKDKLRKFRENETFSCLVQPSSSDLIDGAEGGFSLKSHPLKGHWASDFFHNSNPVVVELGCGKGEYTVDLALRNPDINYIGVDIKGARLWKGAGFAEKNGIKNIAFLRTRIEFIEALFAPGEISEVWITFADPQIGREKKRLTSPLFLDRYRSFMIKGGIVHLKTDSRYLYEYSLAAAQQNGLEILCHATDLYGADKDRVMESSDELARLSVSGADSVKALFEVQTFYEKQYLAKGIDITYLSFVIDKDGEYVSPEWDESLYER